MASSRSLIERFRTQRPTSRAERNRQREKGEVRQTWWKDGVNDGVEEEYGRHEQRRSVLPQASSLKTRTAPVRFSDSLDEPLPSPPTYKYNDADETMMKDILAYGNQRQRARGVRDSLDNSFPSPSYSIERRTTQTRTRFRFTPPRGPAPNEAFELGHTGPQYAARRSVCIDRNMLVGKAQLTADGPSGAASPGKPSGPSAEAATIEITTVLDTTLAMLQDKLGYDASLAGGDALPMLDHEDYVCSEDFPSSINAVCEKLDAGLTCFRLLYEAKYQQEDAAEAEKAEEEERRRKEMEDAVRAERLNEEIFGAMNRTVGCLNEDGSETRREIQSSIPVPNGAAPQEQMAIVMESVAQRVEMIQRLENGELDLNEGCDLPPSLLSEKAPLGPYVDGSVAVLDQWQQRELILYEPQPRSTGNLESTSKGVCADLDITMKYMQARLGFNTDQENGPGDGVAKCTESPEEKEERLGEEEKEREKEIALAKLQSKIDEEDAIQRKREYTDRLDLALLGEDEEGNGGIRPDFVNWDVYKTQSIDMSELLAAQRNADLPPSMYHPAPSGLYASPQILYPGSYDMIPEPIFDSPHPSAPPLPTGEELTGEARAVSRATGLSDPPSRQFSGPSQDCTTAGIFGGVTTYADSSEVMSIQDARERLDRFKQIREAAEKVGTEKGTKKLFAGLKVPSEVEDAQTRLNEFKALRMGTARALQVVV